MWLVEVFEKSVEEMRGSVRDTTDCVCKGRVIPVTSLAVLISASSPQTTRERTLCSGIVKKDSSAADQKHVFDKRMNSTKSCPWSWLEKCPIFLGTPPPSGFGPIRPTTVGFDVRTNRHTLA